MAISVVLSTEGIMNHDAICGAKEFIEAGEIFGIATTIEIEIRTALLKWVIELYN